ncbi:hypothetical protein OG909_31125 [Streptomyces sp. NBC_01754]|uniref:DUF6895 family protein n=1 Tax=Streptomyces sp. NBC_01754 TaxID=2975930 RepID=UPI002DDA1121|nr:hypothetical protein [Streptomyces sp. NBC_01754]WSC96400.1 hypothetical protein OG909_31125 [Streptomyces sp. NBC_01754]
MPSPLDQLSAGTLDWLGKNLEHFDPFSPSGRSAAHVEAKAALELALLCHCAARLDGAPDSLAEAAALVRTLWQRPDFPGLFDAHPGHASSYGLIYAALAPEGIDDTSCRSRLAGLDPDFLSPVGKTPYQRIETRYYADKAGARHGIEPYSELAPRSPLVAPDTPVRGSGDAAPLTGPQAYALTHTAFYLGDFGRTGPGLTGHALTRSRDLVCRMLRHCVEHDEWDLAAELVLTQFILGVEPLRTASGAAAVECLVRAQLPDGALPGRSATLRAADSDPAGEFFAKAYHTTLVTALMTLVVSSARPS